MNMNGYQTWAALQRAKKREQSANGNRIGSFAAGAIVGALGVIYALAMTGGL